MPNGGLFQNKSILLSPAHCIHVPISPASLSACLQRVLRPDLVTGRNGKVRAFAFPHRYSFEPNVRFKRFRDGIVALKQAIDQVIGSTHTSNVCAVVTFGPSMMAGLRVLVKCWSISSVNPVPIYNFSQTQRHSVNNVLENSTLGEPCRHSGKSLHPHRSTQANTLRSCLYVCLCRAKQPKGRDPVSHHIHRCSLS